MLLIREALMTMSGARINAWVITGPFTGSSNFIVHRAACRASLGEIKSQIEALYAAVENDGFGARVPSNREVTTTGVKYSCVGTDP